MIPPASIDGTDITGATIDGQDVQEITVDGNTVFTAGTQINNFPVAYSNLIAWYPFDSATYGGLNADDVTAILGGSGDNTAYNATVNGATYQSSGGVTDINAGANSGGFDFDGSNDTIDFPNFGLSTSNDWSINLWDRFNSDDAVNFGDNISILSKLTGDTDGIAMYYPEATTFRVILGRTNPNRSRHLLQTGISSTQQFRMKTVTFDSSAQESRIYVDGVLGDTDSGSVNDIDNGNTLTAGFSSRNEIIHAQGEFEDLRIYNKVLSASEITQIYNNTEP